MDAAAQILLGVGATTLFHPIAYAKVLIQLGHEPVAPKLTTTIFGSKILMYPNMLKYISHIKEKDGFFGLYRGLYFRLVSNVVNNYASARVFAALTEPIASDEENSATVMSSEAEKSPTSCEDSPAKLFKDTMNEMLSHGAGIIISQPFHVIFIRCVSQFIGGETQYSSLLTSFSEIWKTEGLSGFFTGLFPRLVGEVLTIMLSNVLTYVISNMILNAKPTQDKELRGYAGTFSNLIVSQMTYPFTVVANIMAVNGCSTLLIGRTTNHRGWISCWASLASQNELKRGSSIFWRQYRGPVTFTPGHTLKPIQHHVLTK